MGILDSRNLRKAKELLDKNRHKAGDIVGKAGDKLDQVSNGKTSSLTAKATEAANKYADGATTRHDFGEASGDHDGMPAEDADASGAEANAANAAAATAMTNMANAATNFLNSAAAQAKAVASRATGDAPADGDDDPSSSAPPAAS